MSGSVPSPPASLRHPRQFRDDALGVRDGLEHVAADNQVEGLVGQSQLEDAAVFEAHARAESCAACPRALQMLVDDIDAEQPRTVEHLCQPRGHFPGAAPCVENVGVGA